MRRGDLRRMLKLANRRQPFAVATVVDAEGSVPGKIGSTMVVTQDGGVHGTVGGAGLEERTKRLCLDALASGRGGLHTFDLANWKPEGLDSVCGGTVHISIQIHRPLPHLLLFGGGHCGQAMAQLAASMDWDVTIVDTRAEYAVPTIFPEGTRAIHAEDAGQWCAAADLDDFSHAYLLGHDHKVDVDVLANLLPRFNGHVGAIGSRSKWQSFRQRLLDRGVEQGLVDGVQCPIGVDIGAETPAEIAVSIAGEVIQSLKSQKALRGAQR